MSNRTFLISVVVLLLTLGSVTVLNSRGVPMVVKTNLEKIPMHIDAFQGVEDSFPDSVYRELNADCHVYRHYTDPEGNRVSLYIGYYGTAKGGRTGHNPYACLPSGGWVILDAYPVDIVTADGESPNGRTCKVNYILSEKEGVFETVLHWYQSDGNKVLSNGVQQNIGRFFGRVFHNRNDGAFVRVTVSGREREIDESKAEAMKFAGKVITLLPRYWPEER